MENWEGDISRRYCRVSAFRACHWKYVGCRVSIENLVTRFFLRNACERVRRYRRKSKKMRAGRHPPFTVPGFPWLRSERKWSKLWIFPEREVISMRDETFFFSKRDFLVFNESSSILRWIFDYLCGIFLISFCQKQLQQLHRRSFIGRVK